MIFALIGGDARQTKLAELLRSDGHELRAFALDCAGIKQSDTYIDALAGVDCAVLPMPAASEPGLLNTPASGEALYIDELFSQVPKGTLLLGGRVDADTAARAGRHGLEIHDYFDREETVVANAVLTAEGALEILCRETPISLCGSGILLCGYGRIGKLLAHMLSALGAELTVSARKPADIQWIRACGCRAVLTQELKEQPLHYDIVVNTVPAMIFDRELLNRLQGIRLL
ncbi:MAG: dipicolinate synthase, partial [Oscillospiraceae bacterium]|nr:dipicolinate synthase [Oscillospiraceae bacterium]